MRLDALDQGFIVSRSYAGLDKASDVRHEPDGSWRIKAGARVGVTVSVMSSSRRTHVAVVDPLPAGLEIEGDGFWGAWDHHNLRVERVESFIAVLESGVRRMSYVARATTPGTFIVPPPKAEEMYAPETFGRGTTERVVVE
jgi:uncharacterized protein YfaS (alpha-2-macroglobulin family)